MRDDEVTVTTILYNYSACVLDRPSLRDVLPAIGAGQMSSRHFSTSCSVRCVPSLVIYLGDNGKPICDFLLVINIVTLAASATGFEIFTLKDRKSADFTQPSLVRRPYSGAPLRISG